MHRERSTEATGPGHGAAVPAAMKQLGRGHHRAAHKSLWPGCGVEGAVVGIPLVERETRDAERWTRHTDARAARQTAARRDRVEQSHRRRDVALLRSGSRGRAHQTGAVSHTDDFEAWSRI